MANESEKAGGGAPVPASLAELQRTTDDIARILKELRDAQSSLRTLMLLGSVVIVLLILVFGAATFFKMWENLSRDKVSAEMMDKVKILMPTAERQLAATLHEVLPYYLQMGKERLKVVGPKLEGRLMTERDKLASELQESLGEQINARFAEIADEATKKLSAQFPAVAVDGGRHASEELHKSLTAAAQGLREHVQTLASDQMTSARAVLAKFPVPDVSNTTSDALVRGLLHNLIMLADYEVLTTQPPPSLNTNAINQDIPLSK